MDDTNYNTKDSDAKRLVMLGLMLQALHIMFGFTAIMGMFINHMMIDQSKNTVYHTHIRWQLVTFWLCAALYAAAFFVWYHYGLLWPVATVLLFTFYRIITCAYYYLHEEPLERIL